LWLWVRLAPEHASLLPALRLKRLEGRGAIEAICTELGDELFADDERTRCYKAARKLAANDNVKLYGSLFQKRSA
jgi:hypothetical protein